MVQHEIPPVFDENSRVLVLGSFSVCAVEKSGVFLRAPAKSLLARLERGFR